MKKIILIHGWEGSPESEWFPWLRTELAKKGFEVICPLLPNAEHPILSDWLNTIEKVAGKIDENTIFVGHSLGCVTILQFLIKRLPAIKIGGAIFIAGFSGRVAEPQIAEFYAPDKEIEDIALKIRRKFVIYSDNDSFVPVEKSLQFIKLLSAEKIFIPDKGHFSEDDGVFELPELLEIILSIS